MGELTGEFVEFQSATPNCMFAESKDCLLLRTRPVNGAPELNLLAMLLMTLFLSDGTASEIFLFLPASGNGEFASVCMVVWDPGSAQSAPIIDDWAFG